LDKETLSFKRFSKFSSVIFCRAYRLNHLLELAENGFAASLNIGEQTFDGKKGIDL